MSANRNGLLFCPCHIFWGGGFEYALLSSPSWEHPQVTLLFFSRFFAASTTNQGSVSWCIGQSRYHLPRLASKYVPTCKHAPICLQWNKYNRCVHCLAIFLPLLKRPNWWFLQQRISTGLQGCTGAGTVWLLRGRAWIFPRCDWTWNVFDGVSQWCSLLGSSSYFYRYIYWKCGDMSLMCEISMTKPWFFSLFLQVSTVQPLFMGFGVQPTCLIHSWFHRWNSSVLLVVELPIKQADLSHIPKIFPEVWDGRVPGNLRPFLQKYFTSFDWETRRKGIGDAWEQWKKRGMQMNEGKKMGNIPSGYVT